MPVDFGKRGMTIQRAMVEQHKLDVKDGVVTKQVLWNGLSVRTSDSFSVPIEGVVVCEFLTQGEATRQGVDIRVDGGIQLVSGESLNVLRTWNDPEYESTVTYPYVSKSGTMTVWNVYESELPSGEKIVEKWTGNAGMLVDIESLSERVYRCNTGMSDSPNFDSLVFRITVRPQQLS